MVYKAPQLPKDIADIIEFEYSSEKRHNKSRLDWLKFSNNQPQRLSLIALLKRISAKIEYDRIAITAEILEMKKRTDPDQAEIQQLVDKEKKLCEDEQHIPLALLVYEYTKTPDANWVTNGSMMHKVLKKILKINEDPDELNVISDDDVFTLVSSLHKYVDRNMSDNDLKDLTWGNKRTLLKELDQHLQNAHNQSKQKYLRFINGIPELESLIENLSKTIKEYEAAVDKRFFKNQDRLNACKFMLFIVQSCQALYPYNPDAPENDVVNNNNYLSQWSIISAVQLLVYKPIYDSYTLPPRSLLLKLGLSGMNQDSINRIPDIEKAVFWNTLREHILRLKSNKAYFTDEMKQQWRDMKGNDFLKQINELCTKVIIKQNGSTAPQWLLSKSIAWSATMGIARATTSVATLPIVLSFAKVLPIAIAGTPVGFMLIVTAATVGSYVAVPIIFNKIGELGGYIFSSSVDVAGRTVGRGVAKMLVGEKPDQSDDLFSMNILTPEEIVAKRALIQAWLDAPEHIIPEKQKDQIRKVMHLQKGLEDTQLPTVRRFGELRLT